MCFKYYDSFNYIVIFGAIKGENNIVFFPRVKANSIGLFSITIYISYFLLCLTPVFIEIIENIKWKKIEKSIYIDSNKELYNMNNCLEVVEE